MILARWHLSPPLDWIEPEWSDAMNAELEIMSNACI